jgi:thymidine kinase
MTAVLTFHYGPMYAGKSTALLAKASQYDVRGLNTHTYTVHRIRGGLPRAPAMQPVTSRMDGNTPRPAMVIGAEPVGVSALDALRADKDRPAHVFVDEAQFLTREDVKKLKHAVDVLGVSVSCFGLRTDFRGEIFEGSALLFACADSLVELQALCAIKHEEKLCKCPATMNLRLDAVVPGRVVVDEGAPQVDTASAYISVCRAHHVWALTHKDSALSALPKRARDDDDDGDDDDDVVETVKTVVTVKTVKTVVAVASVAGDHIDETYGRAEEIATYGGCADCGAPDTGYCRCTS